MDRAGIVAQARTMPLVKTALQTFVALMRGINVGSTRKLPMAYLRALCLQAGLRCPQTFIQSGNLIIDAEGDADTLRRLLEKAVAVRIDYGASGITGSKQSPLLIDKACGSPTTGRNWNSVLKIGDMIAARG
jgi:uncharacterized protein (DUF1697 family)